MLCSFMMKSQSIMVLCLWAATFTSASPVVTSPRVSCPFPGSRIPKLFPGRLGTPMDYIVSLRRNRRATRGQRWRNTLPPPRIRLWQSFFPWRVGLCHRQVSGGILTMTTLLLSQPEKPGPLSPIFTNKILFLEGKTMNMWMPPETPASGGWQGEQILTLLLVYTQLK